MDDRRVTEAHGVRCEIVDRVARVTIDRPQRRNALSQDAMHALVDIADRCDADDDVWIMVLTGAGDTAFSAGRDLKDVAERDRQGLGTYPPMRGPVRNVFEAVYECRKPTVAAINGWAIGGGLELAMACDVRLAASHARLGLPEAKRGMGANFGVALLPRLVGPTAAYDLIYGGDDIDAEEALRIGLVTRVFATDEFRDEVDAYVGRLLRRAPLTMRRAKQSIQRTLELPVAAAIRVPLQPDPYASEDRIEGVRAFTEKRPPRFRAR